MTHLRWIVFTALVLVPTQILAEESYDRTVQVLASRAEAAINSGDWAGASQTLYKAQALAPRDAQLNKLATQLATRANHLVDIAQMAYDAGDYIGVSSACDQVAQLDLSDQGSIRMRCYAIERGFIAPTIERADCRKIQDALSSVMERVNPDPVLKEAYENARTSCDQRAATLYLESRKHANAGDFASANETCAEANTLVSGPHVDAAMQEWCYSLDASLR